MEALHCDTLEELKAAIEQYGPGVLYRGQTQHYPGSGIALVINLIPASWLHARSDDQMVLLCG